MFSWRLWQQLAEPDRHNPIFRRASQTYKPSRSPKRRYSVPRPLLLIAVIALIAAVVHEPQLLLLLFEIPIVMITLVVASPALLPLFTLCMGALLAVEVIQGIYREKHQHTYELICSSTPGSLHANWSFAKGILHRGGWFTALRWGSAQSLRLGRIVLGGALLLVVWLLLSDHTRFGFEQVRVLILIALILALYYTHLTQTLVLSLLIGLFSSSFDLNRRDAVFIGVCLYLFAQALSIGLALLFYITCSRLLFEPHALIKLLVESATVALVILSREALIVLLWQPLRHRLNSSWGDSEMRDMAAVLGVT